MIYARSLRPLIEARMADGKWRTASEVVDHLERKGANASEPVVRAILEDIRHDGGLERDMKHNVTMYRAQNAHAIRAIRPILDDVARRRNMEVADIVGRVKSASVVRARQEAMAAALDAGFSSVEVGQAMMRDHVTVLHGVKRHREREAQQ